jgi:type I restriction enzyme S subunit
MKTKLSLPNGWELKRLDSVIKKFIVPQRDRPKTFDGNIPWCRIEDIDGIYLSKSKTGLSVSKEVVESMPLRVYPKGTVIVSCSADLGRCAIIANPLITNQTFIGLVPSEMIDSLYLYYLMGSKSKMLNNLATGATIKYLSKNKFQELLIPLPAITEQQRIVSIIDKCFTAIDQAKSIAEQNLKNAKELFESYLNGVFENKGDDWEESTIGETCILMTGGTPSTTKKEYYHNGKIKWLVSGDINQREIFDCEGRITEMGLSNSNARILPINSVLIALNGQGKTRGTVAMLRTEATCNQSLVSIYPKDDTKILPELIYANLDGRYDEIRKLTGDDGNERRGLNMPIIRKICFTYPKSIKEQKKIISRLDALKNETKKLEEKYKKKIEDLEELKKSILQKAFSGELRYQQI